jgi:arsenical pump membrane protein
VNETLALVALAASLAAAVTRPRFTPDWVVAAGAALLIVLVGALSFRGARSALSALGPTVGFLAALLVLADGCRRAGLFDALGAAMAFGARGQPRRLLAMVFLSAAATTAVLSLDATIVLLTPIVFATAARLRANPRPHVYACTHLANSASLLLPVSNLTNLLAFAQSGLSFGRFAELMALPWLVAVAVEYVVIRRCFRADLAPGPAVTGPTPVAAEPGGDRACGGGDGDGAREDEDGAGENEDGAGEDEDGARGDGGGNVEDGAARTPVFSLVVVALTLAGFVVASAAGVNPAWAALGGAALLTVRALARRDITAGAVARSADVPFLLFVLALGVVVTAVVDNGLASALAPAVPAGTSLPALLAVAGLAAVLAAAVNNLPAVLVLLPLVAHEAGTAQAGAVLAVLLGVNIGPNLSYTGSLATLLWRRVLRDYDADVSFWEFTRLGVATVIPALGLSVVALWAVLPG